MQNIECLCLSIIFIVVATSSLQAQRKFKKHLSYSIFYEQNRSFRFLTYHKSNDFQKEWFDERQSTEKAISTAKYGVNILYHFNEKWAIKSGCSFAQYGRLDQPTNLIIGFAPDTISQSFSPGLNTIPITKPNDENIKFKRKFAYLEIPISAHYKFKKGKSISYLEFGFLLSKSLFERLTRISLNEKSTSKLSSSSSRKFNVGLEFLLGFNVFQRNNVNIQLSPSFSMYLRNKDKNGLKEKLNAYGIRIQMNFLSKR